MITINKNEDEHNRCDSCNSNDNKPIYSFKIEHNGMFVPFVLCSACRDDLKSQIENL